MAQRRMFNKVITDSDPFLDMPATSQVLYFHLNMHADDDGFIGNTKSIMRMLGSSEDDLKLLIAKQFIIPFDSGVTVIRDWRLHNYIRKDRYQATSFKAEQEQLVLNDAGSYSLADGSSKTLETNGQPSGNQLATEVRLGKDRLGKVSKEYSPASAEQFPWKSVVDYLNEKTGKHFKHTETNKKLIMARHNDGASSQDMRTVIDNKTTDWLNDKNMNKFLQPSTLFRPSKFEGYLNQQNAHKPVDPHMNLDDVEDF